MKLGPGQRILPSTETTPITLSQGQSPCLVNNCGHFLLCEGERDKLHTCMFWPGPDIHAVPLCGSRLQRHQSHRWKEMNATEKGHVR